MSITITVQKQLLEEHPELIYQLFYLSEKVEKREQQYTYTPSGYYRKLTELLDFYHLPYQVYSSRNVVLLHVLIIEQELQLATDLRTQLYEWGFGSVDIATDYPMWRQKNWQKPFSLALIDKETLILMSFSQRMDIGFQWLTRPLIFIIGKMHESTVTHKPLRWNSLSSTATLQKPFTTKALQDSIEQLIHVVL